MPRRYETVYIFDSALEEPAIKEKLDRFHALLTKDGRGAIVSVNQWGKRTLAYPIAAKETGYYVVVQFETAADLLREYQRVVKLAEGVLRFLVVTAAREQPQPVAVAAIAADEEDVDEEEA
jgi:small subunit ribosomal protein S6